MAGFGRSMAAGLVLAATIQTAAWAEPAADASPPADANLFVFRVSAAPILMPTSISVDHKRISSFGNGRYTAVKLQPGAHSLLLTWPLVAMQRGDVAYFVVEAGKTYYFDILGVMTSGIGGRMGSGLLAVPSDDGAKAIAECCKFVESKAPPEKP
jgi:hypothetical protein